MAPGTLTRLLAGAVLLAGATLTSAADAKAKLDSRYTFEQTFGTALRLIKVDLGLQVKETNADWGYLLFVYTHPESGKRENQASFSFVKADDQVQVTLQVPDMPSYHEQFILERFKRKLESEHGEPPKPPDKKPPPDEGDDDEGDDNKPIVPGEPDEDDKLKPRERRWPRKKRSKSES
jgi:hypothetical protein